MSEPIITARNLRKAFREVVAVADFNVEIARGEMFGLVGPDGAGKSTTIRMLCGILKPTRGGGIVAGYDLWIEPERIKSKIGYLSQQFSLYGDLTVDENMEFFAEIHNVRDYEERQERLLEFTRLTPFRKRLVDHLSGGMKQKLALACTLIHTPELLFLDEPTSGVDPVSRREFWKILSDLLKSGITIVMSTPYLDEAERCSRVGMMNKGTVLVIDSPSEIKRRLKGVVVELVMEKIRPAAEVLKRSGDFEVQAFGDRLNVVMKDSEKAVGRILKLLEDQGIHITSWRLVSPSLENVFISLMSQS